MRIIIKFHPGLSNERIVDIVTEKIMDTGFCCQGCGECCLSHSDQNLVIISPPEIRNIMDETSLEWDRVAEPYPEFIEEEGAFFTFSWVLKRERESCVFFRNGRCTVYCSRSSICRTYPFMVTEDGLLVSECRGIGEDITPSDARRLAYELIERRDQEIAEEEMTELAYNEKILDAGCFYVIDSEGVKTIDR